MPPTSFFTAELGKEIAKVAILSATSVVATVGGLYAIATAIEFVEKIKNRNKTAVAQ
jgi:hypothetical protein